MADVAVEALAVHQGASIAVMSGAGVPDRFKLAIPAGSFSKTCKIARKAAGELKVRFA